jgi:hypothetical protein
MPEALKKRKDRKMIRIGLNRTLDILVTFMVLGLGFVLAGATASLGA